MSSMDDEMIFYWLSVVSLHGRIAKEVYGARSGFVEKRVFPREVNY
jgi:hypothetical protein